MRFSRMLLRKMHARNRRLLVHGRKPSALMKSRRRIAALWRTASWALPAPLSRPCHQCVVSRLKSFGDEEESMSEVDGATLIARSLKQQGIDHLFGVVGFPVTPIAAAGQKEGVAYIGMRNEQAASYAAQAYGYLTGRPGACIVVTGPGVVHGLAGLASAQQNCWPMILFGGASETYRGGMGAFQEERQVLIASPFCKFAHGIESVQRIPYYVEMATRKRFFGANTVFVFLPRSLLDLAADLRRILTKYAADYNELRTHRSLNKDAPIQDVLVHISAVERAGMSSLNEGQKVTFDIVADRRTGKSAAENLRAA